MNPLTKNICKAVMPVAAALSLAVSARAAAPNPRATALDESKPNAASAAAQVVDVDTLPPHAAAQIDALLRDKNARTPAQKKISSELIYSARMAAGKEALPGIAHLDTGVAIAGDKKVLVDISAHVTPDVIELVKAHGGEITGSYPDTKMIVARVPLTEIEALASDARIRSVRLPKVPMLQAKSAPVSSAERYNRVVDQLLAAVTVPATLMPESVPMRSAMPTTNASVVPGFRATVAEGDFRHRARAARLAFGISGAGLKVGVLSDSFDAFGGGYRHDINTGDLPGPGNPNGLTKRVELAGSGDYFGSDATDEGRAMCQIIHAVLPGAKIYFATAYNSFSDFGNNIRALRGIAKNPGEHGNVPGGCDIIVDDVSYSQEAALRDGATAGVDSPADIAGLKQAVNDVVADGCLYFSSAANSGNKDDHTSGTWEGDFVDGGDSATAGLPPNAGRVHSWKSSGDTAHPANRVTAGANYISLEWSDPLGQSSNDYDIVVLNNKGDTVIGLATDTQDGDDDPTEAVYGPPEALAPGAKIVILKAKNAAPRFLSLETGRGQLQYNTAGQTRGHATAPGAFSVAATPTTTSVGPSFPAPFAPQNQVETFSSDGPRRVFFDENNIAYNGLTVATGGGIVRQKPDVTGADGAPNSVPGFERFYGTSAAAPHAAAISGLVKLGLKKGGDSNPQASEVRALLQNTATDIEARGVDRDSGYGVLDAFQAVQASGAPGGAGLDLAKIVATEVADDNSNGNGRLEPGETAKLNLPLVNVGVATAKNIGASLSTDTPGVTLLTANRMYDDIDPGSTKPPRAPFSFKLDPDFECSQTIRFKLTLNYLGAVAGVTPQTHDFEVGTGLTEIAQFFTELDGTTPPSNPRYTAKTGDDQIGRLLGTGVASSCAHPKETPPKSGTQPDLPRHYDAYTIMNDGPARCVKVTYSPPQADPPNAPVNFVGCAAYGKFHPEDVRQGYLGDAGSNYVSNPGGFAEIGYSFVAPANAPFTIVVFESNSDGTQGNPPTSNTYGLKVDGLAFCDPQN